MDRNRFIPEDKGRIVTTFLMNFFGRYVQYDFTADLEEKLDEVSAGELDWRTLLRDFWRDFSAAIGETKDLKISQVIDVLDEILAPALFAPTADGTDPRKCPSCGDGRLGLKLGRFGAFVGCSNYPECRFTRQLGAKDGEGDAGPRELGPDPQTEEMISVRSGRFGPYIQRGEQEKDGDKPKRASIPKGTDASTVDLEMALRLLSLPRTIGIHPENQKPIVANFGRFGPYVNNDGQYASLDSPDEVFTVGINRAVTLLAEKKANPRGRRGPQALKELGAHPVSGTMIKVMKGRYGPYVTDGDVNATLPNDADPETVTLDRAVALIDERIAKGGGKKKKAKKAKPAPKAKPAAKPKATAKPKAKAKAKADGTAKPKSAKKKPEPVTSE
jgi:DNA topoisomerase-1